MESASCPSIRYNIIWHPLNVLGSRAGGGGDVDKRGSVRMQIQSIMEGIDN